MKMKQLVYIWLLACTASLAGCGLDNMDEPSSQLTGKIVYQNNALGLRHGKVQFELYQDTYELHKPIPVYVAYDGSFSAMLFDGEYRMVAKNNNGPWLNDSTTLNFSIKGNTYIEYEVTPYFTLSNVSIVLAGNTVTGVCNVKQVAGNKTAQSLALFIGKHPFTDADSYNYIVRKSAFPVNIGGNTLTQDVSSYMADNPTLYARFGLQINGVSEYIYSEVFKIK